MKHGLLFSLIFLLILADNSWGAAIANRRERMQQMAQERAKQEYMMQQQMIQQQKAMAAKKQMANQSANQRAFNTTNEMSDEPTEEVVQIKDIWKTMETTSDVWLMMIDAQPKVMTVAREIDFYKQKGITIRKDPSGYVQLIDQIVSSNPEILKRPFADIMRYVAVLEYDFDNGYDPDELAKKLLGENLYHQNRQRLGIEKSEQQKQQ